MRFLLRYAPGSGPGPDTTSLVYLPGKNPLAPVEEYRGFLLFYELYDYKEIKEGSSGTFNLCWGQKSDLLNVQLGQITIEGVSWKTYYCTLGFVCNIKLKGLGLSARNGVQVLKVGQSCFIPMEDRSVVSDNQVRAITNPQQYSFGFVSTERTFVMGYVYEGEVTDYPVCWAEDVFNVFDFNIFAGMLSLSGPFQDGFMTNECTLGEACTIYATGRNLHPVDNIYVVRINMLCVGTRNS